MRVSSVDNSRSSSQSSIELILLKRIQLLKENKYFVYRFRKSLLSLPHNLKVLYSSAAVNLYCILKFIARSNYKALTIAKNTSFITFLFYLLVLIITSVIYVSIKINGISDSVGDFALKTFEHDDFIRQLSVSKPVTLFYNDAWKNKSDLFLFSQGSYANSTVSKPVTLLYNDAWKNKSELFLFSQGSYANSITLANFTSVPSFGYLYSFGIFSSSSIQASYDHQNSSGDEEKNSRGNEEFDSNWWLIPCIIIRPRFPPRVLSIRQARRAGSKKWKRRRDRFLKGYEDGTTAVDGCVADILQKVGFTSLLNSSLNSACRYLVALLFQCVRRYEDAAAVDYFFVKLNDTAAHTRKITVCLIRGCKFLIDEVFVCGYSPSIYSIDFLKPSMK